MTIRITSSHLAILLTFNTGRFLRLPEAGGGTLIEKVIRLEKMKIVLILKFNIYN